MKHQITISGNVTGFSAGKNTKSKCETCKYGIVTSGMHYIMDYRTNTGIVQRGEQNCTCTYTGERTISIIDGEIQCSAYVRNETLVCKGENENV